MNFRVFFLSPDFWKAHGLFSTILRVSAADIKPPEHELCHPVVRYKNIWNFITITFYHIFMASCLYIEECLSSVTGLIFVSFHSASRNCHTSSPVRVGLCPCYQISLCDVPNFTALCLLLPVALSRDHEGNGVRIKNHGERSEKT